MPRKKKVEEPVVTQGDLGITEEVDVSAVVPEIEKAEEAVEMVWVDTLGPGGRMMIQIPKK